MPPETPRKHKPIPSEFVDPATDYTGWDLRRGNWPYQVVLAAKHGGVQNHVIVGATECVNCKRKMWTCDMKLEDTCVECEFIAHEENRDLQIQRARRQMTMGTVNPFAEPDDGPSDSITIRR